MAFESWINSGWKKRTGAEDFVYAEDEPEEYTILKLEIPDEHLAPDDLKMLADDDLGMLADNEADSDAE